MASNVFTNVFGGGGTGTALAEYVPASGSLASTYCTNYILNNYGQSGNVTLTLPAAAVGMNFIFIAGSTAAFYYRFDPAGTNSIFMDGITTGNGKYLGLSTVTKGDAIQFIAFKTGASAYDWMAVPIIGAWGAEA